MLPTSLCYLENLAVLAIHRNKIEFIPDCFEILSLMYFTYDTDYFNFRKYKYLESLIRRIQEKSKRLRWLTDKWPIIGETKDLTWAEKINLYHAEDRKMQDEIRTYTCPECYHEQDDVAFIEVYDNQSNYLKAYYSIKCEECDEIYSAQDNEYDD